MIGDYRNLSSMIHQEFYNHAPPQTTQLKNSIQQAISEKYKMMSTTLNLKRQKNCPNFSSQLKASGFFTKTNQVSLTSTSIQWPVKWFLFHHYRGKRQSVFNVNVKRFLELTSEEDIPQPQIVDSCLGKPVPLIFKFQRSFFSLKLVTLMRTTLLSTNQPR